MSFGSQQGSQTTVQNQEPWIGAQPYLMQGFGRASQLLGSNTPQYYPNSTVTPFSTQTSDALSQQEAIARQGSGLPGQAMDQLSATIGGEYLDPGNPHLAALTQRFGDEIGRSVDSRSIGSGRDVGSGAAESEYTRQLGNALAPVMFGQYGQERANQLNAVNQVPGAMAQRFADPAALAAVGAQREGLGEAQMADAVARWNFMQNLPAMKLQQFNEAIRGSGALGGTTSTMQPTSRNPLLTALGGASTGAGIGSLLAGQGQPTSALWPLLGGAAGYFG